MENLYTSTEPKNNPRHKNFITLSTKYILTCALCFLETKKNLAVLIKMTIDCFYNVQFCMQFLPTMPTIRYLSCITDPPLHCQQYVENISDSSPSSIPIRLKLAFNLFIVNNNRRIFSLPENHQFKLASPLR